MHKILSCVVLSLLFFHANNLTASDNCNTTEKFDVLTSKCYISAETYHRTTPQILEKRTVYGDGTDKITQYPILKEYYDAQRDCLSMYIQDHGEDHEWNNPETKDAYWSVSHGKKYCYESEEYTTPGLIDDPQKTQQKNGCTIS